MVALDISLRRGRTFRHQWNGDRKVLQLTGSDFHWHVEASPVLVVEFSADPAMPRSHPLADTFPEVTFAQIDPGREPAISSMFGIASTPAVLIFREGVAMYLEAAAHSPERIAGLLRRICALDMAEVRASIEEERAKTAVHMRRMCPAARRGPINQ